jgi:hypothetical protein
MRPRFSPVGLALFAGLLLAACTAGAGHGYRSSASYGQQCQDPDWFGLSMGATGGTTAIARTATSPIATRRPSPARIAEANYPLGASRLRKALRVPMRAGLEGRPRAWGN